LFGLFYATHGDTNYNDCKRNKWEGVAIIMKKCTTIEEGVANVLTVLQVEQTPQWQFVPAKEGELTDTLILDGEAYPLFWWRADPQVATMHDLAPTRDICSMKLNRTGSRSAGLERLLYKELDIAEFIMDTRVRTVMNFRNGNSMNMLCTMENDRVALFELAATLHDDSPEQGRHTFWGSNGMASDRVVSQKIPSEALYLFTQEKKEPELYSDLFIYTYGLSRTDTIKAAAITEILLGRRSIRDWKARDAHYRCCMAAAAASAQQVRRITVKED